MSFSSDPATQVNQLPISLEFPKEPERFYETITLWAKQVANSVNSKEGALYSLQELTNFNQYFTVGRPELFRNVYRKVFDMVALNGGSIAAGATFSTPHNIPLPPTITNLNGTHIYGSATNSDVVPNGPKRMPLPYAATVLTRNIEIYFDNLNVVIVNGGTQTALTYATIVLEYLKN